MHGRTLIFSLIAALSVQLEWSRAEGRLDSLNKIIGAGKKDISYLRALNEVGWESRIIDPERALQCVRYAIRLADSLNEKTELGRSYKVLGNIHKRRGEYTMALEQYKKTSEIAEEAQREDYLASLYNDIGNVYWNLGELSQSEEYYVKARDIFTALLDDARNQDFDRKELEKGLANSYGNLGNAYGYQGDYPMALKSFLMALQVYEGMGDKERAATALNNIGLVYANQGELQKALEYYNKAINSELELGDKAGLARGYNNIGLIHENMAAYEEALMNYKKALVLETEMQNKEGLARLYNNLGGIYQYQEQYDSSLAYLKMALKEEKELGEKVYMTYTFNALASLYSKTGKREQAIHCIDSAIAIAGESGALRELAEGYYRKSSIFGFVDILCVVVRWRVTAWKVRVTR